MNWYPTNPGEFWTMASAIVTALGFFAAAVYALLTYLMFRVAQRTAEREDRPVIRLRTPEDFHSGLAKKPVLGNIGKGVALTSVVFTSDGTYQFVWVVASGEEKEISNIKFAMGEKYRVYYQDVAARWHLTEATPEEHRTMNRFCGVVRARTVPQRARDEAQIAP